MDYMCSCEKLPAQDAVGKIVVKLLVFPWDRGPRYLVSFDTKAS
jgi:hypothetical protein